MISLTPHRKRRRGRVVDDLECNLQISHVNQRSHRKPTLRGVEGLDRASRSSVSMPFILYLQNIDQAPYIRRKHNAKSITDTLNKHTIFIRLVVLHWCGATSFVGKVSSRARLRLSVTRHLSKMDKVRLPSSARDDARSNQPFSHHPTASTTATSRVRADAPSASVGSSACGRIGLRCATENLCD